MIRILIIDDLKTVRQMLEMLLASQSDMEVVGTVADGESALELIAQLQPDVAIVDLEMPGMSGIEVIRTARQRYLSTNLLVLTATSGEDVAAQVFREGAKGYLPKTASQAELLAAIRSAYQGLLHFNFSSLERIAATAAPSFREHSLFPKSEISEISVTGTDIVPLAHRDLAIHEAQPPEPKQWNLFYRNRRLLVLTLCLICAWGLSSFFALPRMEDPVPLQRVGLITTQYPGASAQRVETLVTDPIETTLLEIDRVDTIRSTSQAGSSVIVVELQDSVTDVDRVWSKVRDKLTDVEPNLPSGTSAIAYEDIEPRAFSQLIALQWNLNTPVNSAILSRLSTELGDRLQVLNGTAKIDYFGAPTEEITVEIRPSQLTALGLSIRDVVQQIQASDAKVAAGQVRSSSNELLIEVDSELDSLNRVRQIPIRSSTTSQVTRLGDIAWVEKSIQDPPSDLAIVSGKSGITLALLADSDRRIDSWSEQVHQILADFQQQLPPGIELINLFDQSTYVNKRLNSLFLNLLFGCICVVASTTLLMGWSSAMIVGISLPLSMLMVFGGMRLFGIPLHQMSVTGLVVALGLLIDNAIIIVDEVKHKLYRGTPPATAVASSARSLSIPLLASTLTTVLAFMPTLLIPGGAAEFMGALSLSVILALSSSLFLSLTVIPALAGLQHRILESFNHSGAHTLRSPRPWWQQGLALPKLARQYSLTIDWVMAKPIMGIMLALCLPTLGFIAASTLDEQFFPPADRDQFQIEFELSPQATLAQTQSTVFAARERILEHPEVKDVHWFVGRSAPSFYYNMQRNRRDSPNYAHGMVQTASHRGNRSLIRTLQSDLEIAFPEARVLVRQLEQGPTIRAPIELRLFGPDLEGLRLVGKDLQSQLSRVEYMTSTSTSLVDSVPKIALQLDEEQAQLAGLDNQSIAEQLDTNLEGAIGGSIFEGSEEIPIRVRLSNQDRGSLDRIASTELLPPTADNSSRSPLPLSAVGEWDLKPDFASISRRNGQRINEINGFIAAGILPSTVLKQVQNQLTVSNFQLPPGYRLEIGGEAAERDRAVNDLLSTTGILVVVMMAVLVLSLGSFRAAGSIVLVGVFAVGLGLLSLRLFNYPLGFMAILGIVGLIGVAINDSIVVLSALRNHPQAAIGDRIAIRETVMASTRHVLATTLTTVTGFTPLLLAGGDFWPPMAICIAGGVVGSTLLALYFIPCLHLLLLRWQGKSFFIKQLALLLPLIQPIRSSLRH